MNPTRTLTLLLTITLTLAACRPAAQLPTPIATPAPTHTATITPTPTRTTTPTLDVAALTPSPTPTPIPYVPALPAAYPYDYTLKPWTEDNPYILIEAARDYANCSICLNTYDRYGTISVYEAFAIEETLLHLPNLPNRSELEWQIVKNLMYDGYTPHPHAFEYFIYLLERDLNNGTIDETQIVEYLDNGGLHGHLTDVPNLFGDGRNIPVLSMFGPAFAIERTDQYTVRTIIDFYSPGVYAFDHQIGDHTADGLPEIAATYSYPGSPWVTEWNQLKIYQWQGGQWGLLLFDGETGLNLSGLTSSWHYQPIEGSPTDAIIATHYITNNSFSARLQEQLTYTWDGDQYRLTSTELLIPDQVDFSDSYWEIFGFSPLWEWSEEHNNFAIGIPYMESALANWDNDSPYNDAINLRYGPAYKDYFRFQLARTYAHSGNFTQARLTLQDIIDAPAAPEYHLMPDVAQAYLSGLSNLTQAETAADRVFETYGIMPDTEEQTGLYRDKLDVSLRYSDFRLLTYSGHTPTPQPPAPTPLPEEIFFDAEDFLDQARQLIFQDHAPQAAIALIEDPLNDHRRNKSPCWRDDDCAQLQYLLALAYELNGDDRQARDTYWYLWHDYPATLYAVLASQKLQCNCN